MLDADQQPSGGDDAAAIRAAIWGPERRNLTIGLILTVSMAAFEALAVATVLPGVVEDIGGLPWYGWVFSGFMLANLVSITMAGHAADQQGVALPFISGSILFVIGLVGAGMARWMPLIVVCRIAQGLGAGAISAVAYAAIARGYVAATRPRMLAMLSSAWVVPGLIGPAIAVFVADHVGWRWVFLGLAPPTIVASALAVPSLRRLDEAHAANPASTPTSQTGLSLKLAAGTGAAMYGLGCGHLGLAALLLIAGAMLAVPALRALLPAGTLRAAPGLPAAVACVGLLGFSFFAAEAFLPLSLTHVRGQSASLSGIALTAAAVMWTTGAWLQAHLVKKRSRRDLTSAGLLLIIIGCAGIASVVAAPVPVSIAIVAWGVAALGMGIAYSTATLVVLESAPSGNEGASTAAAQLANVLGTALGTGIGGAIVAIATSMPSQPIHTAITIVDAVAIAVTIVALAAARRLPSGR